MNICQCNFDSQIAYINGKKISIIEYLADSKLQGKKDKLVCKMGNQLIKYKSNIKKSHFKHKNVGDPCMTKWHSNWQAKFDVKDREIAVGNRRADVIYKSTVIEFQNSKISSSEVKSRTKNYTDNDYNVMWIINCKNSVNVTKYVDNDSTCWMIEFHKDTWKYQNFLYLKYVYLDHDKKIYRIKPSMVKHNLTVTNNRTDKSAFVDKIKTGFDWEKYMDPRGKIYLTQRGAGCGKTYESVQLIDKDKRFINKDTFIYITKTHSAKDVIYKEFIDQTNRGDLINIKKNITDTDQCGKQYVLSYINKSGQNINVVIGTVDSLAYSIGTKQAAFNNVFEGLLNSIRNNCVNVNSQGQIKYAGDYIKICRNCLIIIDESQDLGPNYTLAFDNLIDQYYCDIYLIGDELQSIYNQNNIYTYVKNDEKFKSILIKDSGKNIIKRFHNKKFINFVNQIVPYDKFNLPPVEGICNGKKCSYEHCNDINPVTIFTMKTIYNNDSNHIKVETEINKIIGFMRAEIKDYNYAPENFLFLFPYLNKNYFANQLLTRVQKFWIDFHKSNKSYRNFVFLHKSEENKPINLQESIGMTRFMSIHASKGNGCEVVFLIGASEYTLKMYSGDKNNLIYESLLHVAITRQKKSIYIGLNEDKQDDIYMRFREIDPTINLKPNTNLIKDRTNVDYITKYILTNKYDTIYSKILQPNKCRDNIPEENDQDKKNVIDWGHHVLRYSMVFYYLACHLSIDGRMNNDQFITILCKLSKKKIGIYEHVRYYEFLNQPKLRDGKRVVINTIPVLRYKNTDSEFNKYTNILVRFILKIQSKLENCKDKLPKLCQLEAVVLWYMYKITDDLRFSEISITDIYNLFYYYDQCSNNIDNTHSNKCICRKEFTQGNAVKDNNSYNQIRKSICNHYEKIAAVKDSYTKYKEYMSKNYPDEEFSYNVNKLVHFVKDANFNITQKFPFLGWSKNYVVYFIIKGTFSDINYEETMTSILTCNYILNKCCPKGDNDRYRNKRSLVCIFTTKNVPIIYNIDIKPHIAFFNNSIKEYIRDQYVKYNKIVYDFYVWSKDNIQDKKAIEAVINELSKPTMSAPAYLSQCISKLKSEIEDIVGNESDDIETKINNLVSEKSFLDRLNNKLTKCIKSTFGNNVENKYRY